MLMYILFLQKYKKSNNFKVVINSDSNDFSIKQQNNLTDFKLSKNKKKKLGQYIKV